MIKIGSSQLLNQKVSVLFIKSKFWQFCVSCAIRLRHFCHVRLALLLFAVKIIFHRNFSRYFFVRISLHSCFFLDNDRKKKRKSSENISGENTNIDDDDKKWNEKSGIK